MPGLTYLDFDLAVHRTPEGYRVRVDAPTGQAGEAFAPPFSDLELENFLLRVGRPRRAVRRIDAPDVQAAKTFGERLGHGLEWGTPVLHLRAADGRIFEMERVAEQPPPPVEVAGEQEMTGIGLAVAPATSSTSRAEALSPAAPAMPGDARTVEATGAGSPALKIRLPLGVYLAALWLGFLSLLAEAMPFVVVLGLASVLAGIATGEISRRAGRLTGMIAGWAANPAVATALLLALDARGGDIGEAEAKAAYGIVAVVATVLGLLALRGIVRSQPDAPGVRRPVV